MERSFEDGPGCLGTSWAFLLDQDSKTIDCEEHDDRDEERVEYIGHSFFDIEPVSLMYAPNAQDDNAKGSY